MPAFSLALRTACRVWADMASQALRVTTKAPTMGAQLMFSMCGAEL